MSVVADLPSHPFADVLPLLEGEAFGSFVADIKANGLLEPITIHEGLILDGRNRWNACKAAGVEPQFLEFDGDDPLAFVLSLNLHRRHLTPSQCSMLGADLATMRQGARTDLRQPSASLPEVSQAQAAGLSTASERGVRTAVFVKKKGGRDLVQAVRDGKITVNLAARLATTSEDVQRRAVAEPGRAHVLVKQAARAEREKELGARQLAWPTQVYGVIYADPPWRFEPYSRETGMDRAADNHYSTMTLDEIKALNVPSIAAAADCVLYLWATVPMLPQALEVMVAWGFEYVSGHAWVKTNPGSEGLERTEATRAGTGYWILNEHELLLVGKRGRIPAPAPGTQIGSVIMAPVGPHSAKPLIVVETIERHFPNLPKIELFCRGAARAGWAAWGAEAKAVE